MHVLCPFSGFKPRSASTPPPPRPQGKLVVKEAPRAVSERDDRLLAEKLEALEAANKEVDGDADNSDEGEEEGMGDFDAEAGPATIEV